MAYCQMEGMHQTETHEIAYMKSDREDEPVLVSGGDDNCLYGACQDVICKDVNKALLKNLAFRCTHCDEFIWFGEI